MCRWLGRGEERNEVMGCYYLFWRESAGLLSSEYCCGPPWNIHAYSSTWLMRFLFLLQAHLWQDWSPQRDLSWWLLWTTCVIAVWCNCFFFIIYKKKKLDLIFSKVLDFRLKWTSSSQFHRIICLIIFPLCTLWFTVHLHIWLCDWHRPLPPMRCWQSSYTAHNKYSF